jgi:hypothetical protein
VEEQRIEKTLGFPIGMFKATSASQMAVKIQTLSHFIVTWFNLRFFLRPVDKAMHLTLEHISWESKHSPISSAKNETLPNLNSRHFFPKWFLLTADNYSEFLQPLTLSMNGHKDGSEVIPMKKIAYHSYLLRLWLEKHDKTIFWRASMEDPHTGQQLFFFRPEDLTDFLSQLKNDLKNNKDEK